jgi:hypothetical protein
MQAALVETLALCCTTTIFGACSQGARSDPETAAYAAVSAATGGDVQVAVRDNVPLYETGPQQLGIPDMNLKKGTLVRIVQKQFGYSLVRTVDGDQLGWVANEDLGVVPPAESNYAGGY